ncbi:hypothetical protein [Arsenicicoccus sp. oral taxon 190]|uniref:hypothetical protein n=1 Tax=Arsenicicoccus sp. oral taxon 190 TaxID=1658671 RepID=UPI000679FEA2|nr:hypothetical protein [Arsenicicoccus sp. oral taxon 190]AKT51087.1 hypothetical protein ADJ73_06725 [Arsenicicoccus sp. oral taxon 190]
MNTQSLPTSRPGLSLTLYPDHEALHITDELQQLELVGARVPFGVAPGDRSAGSWLETCAAEEGFRLVTLAMDGVLVGFVAGVVGPARVELRHLTMAASVRTRHPELVDLLGEALVESSQLPWAEVRVAPTCPALAHLASDPVNV